MKSITIVISSYSEIVTAGITAIISGIRDAAIRPIAVAPDDLSDNIVRLSPKALILDTMAFGTQNIERIKAICPADSYIIGFSHCSMPTDIAKRFNAIIGINDSAYTIENILKQSMDYGNNSTPPADLTPREKEVVIGIVKGLSNKEIASEINVSVNTVMTHRRNIATKLQIHSPAGLTIYAIVSKLVSIDDIKQSIS